MRRPTNAYQSLLILSQAHSYFESLQKFHTSLEDDQLLKDVTEIAQEHHFSQSLAQLIKQSEKLSSLIKTFPSHLKFNVIPEHKASPHHQLALESLTVATTDNDDRVKLYLSKVVDNFLNLFSQLDTHISSLENAVAETKQHLMLSDLTDDVLEDIPVYGISQEALMIVLTTLEDLLKESVIFTSEEYRAFPTRAEEDLRHLKEALLPLGKILGLGFGPHGLEKTVIEDPYLPIDTSFGNKGYSLTGLMYLLEVSEMVLINLKAFTSRHEDLRDKILEEASNLPESIILNELDYDKMCHLTLFVSYMTFITKISEQVLMSVSLLLSMVDTALNIDLS